MPIRWSAYGTLQVALSGMHQRDLGLWPLTSKLHRKFIMYITCGTCVIMLK